LPYPEACIISHASVYLFAFHRTSGEQGDVSYQVPGVTGMVVLDAIHYIQHNLDTDLAARWNCKAAKCGRAARRSTAGHC
jgi:succinate dehydrogenase / fumarate reductase iron-sulfur subunit